MTLSNSRIAPRLPVDPSADLLVELCRHSGAEFASSLRLVEGKKSGQWVKILRNQSNGRNNISMLLETLCKLDLANNRVAKVLAQRVVKLIEQDRKGYSSDTFTTVTLAKKLLDMDAKGARKQEKDTALAEQIRGHCAPDFACMLPHIQDKNVGKWIHILMAQRDGIKHISRLLDALCKIDLDANSAAKGLAKKAVNEMEKHRKKLNSSDYAAVSQARKLLGMAEEEAKVIGRGAKLLEEIQPHCDSDFVPTLIILEGKGIEQWIRLLKGQRDGLKHIPKLLNALCKLDLSKNPQARGLAKRAIRELEHPSNRKRISTPELEAVAGAKKMLGQEG